MKVATKSTGFWNRMTST